MEVAKFDEKYEKKSIPQILIRKNTLFCVKINQRGISRIAVIYLGNVYGDSPNHEFWNEETQKYSDVRNLYVDFWFCGRRGLAKIF